MSKLSHNWITEGTIDFEYKKYTLLAYLQHISQHFNEQRLYPFLADLIFHHQNLVSLQRNKEAVCKGFPKEVKKIDFDQFKLEYERVMNDSSYIEEIENIINYSLPKIEAHLGNGKEIYNTVETELEIFPIGILPLQTDIGYMLLSNGNSSDTQVFGYEMTFFESATEKYRAMKTHFVSTYIRQFTNTYEAIKLDLIRLNKDLPNPATFVVQSQQAYPFKETLFPIAKRSLVRFLSTAI